MDSADSGFARWILASLGSGIVAVDERGRLAFANRGAQRILGCPEGDLADALGADCRRALAAQPALVRLLLDTLAGRRALSRAELVLERGVGAGPSTIGFTLCPVRDASGRPRGAAILFRDLTPVERMDEQERLRERLTALGQMAAGMAHEIRNPLAGMEVLAGLLRRRLRDRPDDLELVDELCGELRRVAATVSDSLDFVRAPALERAPVDPRALLEEALGVALARVSFEGRVEREYAAALPPLRADAEKLRAVLADLVVNALEALSGWPGERRLGLGVVVEAANGEGRSVRVERDGRAADETAPASEVVIRISDSGPGIPAELRERVFYPFFTTKERGSGVGLANAQKIAASHGGSLELESSAGAGCHFRLRLPLDPPAEVAPLSWGASRPRGARVGS